MSQLYLYHVSHLESSVLCDCVRFMENHLDKPPALKAFQAFFTPDSELAAQFLCSIGRFLLQ